METLLLLERILVMLAHQVTQYSYGINGAAFGLGFTIGPFIGGNYPTQQKNGMSLLGLYLKHIHTSYPALLPEYYH